MLKKLILWTLVTVLCLIQCAIRSQTKIELNKISIIYISEWNLNQAAKITTLIKNEKNLNPILTLINSEIFSDSLITDLNKGLLEIDVLNESQIDAVLLTPNFLKWGIDNCKELIKRSNFYCLAANVKDKATNQTLGQEFLIKNLDKTQIAVIGINYDSTNLNFKDTNIEFRNQNFIVMKLLLLVENRSDFQFILTQTNDTLDFPVDFIFGAPMKNNTQILPLTETGVYKLEIGFDDMKNILELKRTNITFDSLPEDSTIKAIILSHQIK